MSNAPKLSKSQIKVLQALRSGAELCRSDIAEITGIHTGFCNIMGQNDPETRKPNSLWGRNYVQAWFYEMEEGPSKVYYQITKSGKKALEAALKEAK